MFCSLVRMANCQLFHIWTSDLHHQRLTFIRIFKHIVTSPSDMELSPWNQTCFRILVHMGKYISWTLPSVDIELVATIRHSKGFMKTCSSILVTFGAVSPWIKACFMVLYALVILCDHISWTLQSMEMNTALSDTARHEPKDFGLHASEHQWN